MYDNGLISVSELQKQTKKSLSDINKYGTKLLVANYTPVGVILSKEEYKKLTEGYYLNNPPLD